MFVERLQKDNPKFIEAIVRLQQAGKLLPDSYAVDMEQYRANAKAIVESANAKGIKHVIDTRDHLLLALVVLLREAGHPKGGKRNERGNDQ